MLRTQIAMYFDDQTRDRNASVPITSVLARIKAAGPTPDDYLLGLWAE